MSPVALTCKTNKRTEILEILSPLVGRAKLRVHQGQAIVGGQTLGDFFCLNQHYVLKASDDCLGRIIKIKDHDRMINLAYGEVFLCLHEAITHSASSRSPKIDDAIIDKAHSIHAPMDGMFYLSSSPETPPFVRIGDEISPGATIGLIEVMKCFYPVKYQGNKATKITGISIKNATPVNCGTQIFTISG